MDEKMTEKEHLAYVISLGTNKCALPGGACGDCFAYGKYCLSGERGERKKKAIELYANKYGITKLMEVLI
jgi:hypothetical protein